MAEEAWLRADIIPRFRATCGVEGGERDRLSEVPCGPAGGRAGRLAGAPPRFGQAFVQARGEARGEAFSASDAPSARGQAVKPEEDRDCGQAAPPRRPIQAELPPGGTQRDCRNCRLIPAWAGGRRDFGPARAAACCSEASDTIRPLCIGTPFHPPSGGGPGAHWVDLDCLGPSLFRGENPRPNVLDFLGFPWISVRIETYQWVTRILS